MRQITDVEMLALAKLLEMETHSLGIAKASMMAMSDEQLKKMAGTGIATAETRIAGLQQFLSENSILGVQNTDIQ